MSSVITSV